MASEYILELKEIEKSFSTVKVLKGVSLKLKKGQILGLCGENGAGKSTLMNVLGGVYQKNGGTMLLDGEEYAPKTPVDATEAGIAFIHQELNLFLNMTVRQNFMIEKLPKKGPFIDVAKIRRAAEKQLGDMDQNIPVDMLVGDLNIGQRQMVEIAKEIAKDAKIVIFDEPTSSLSAKECQKLFEIIKGLAAKGISVIYISHILNDVFNLCDEIMVLRDGETIDQKPISELTKQDVIYMMVGRELHNLFPYVEKNPGKELLAVNNVKWGTKVKDISLSVKAGEIAGVFGLMGAGRSELANLIFGVEKMDEGEVFIDGKKIDRITAHGMKEMGVAYISENRREEGLFMDKSLKDNIVITHLSAISNKMKLVDKKKEIACAEDQIGKLGIKTYDLTEQTADQFSGGNQQKIVMAKWLLTNPHIFILDEPTRGVDVGAKYDIYEYINDLALNGSAVLFISSEIEELMGVCDRIMVMSNGKLIGELKRDEFEPSKLLEMAIGGIE